MTSQEPTEKFTESLSPTDAGDVTAVNHVETIETVIDTLDQENTAMVSQNEEGYLWKFKYGSVEVFVKLTGISDDDTFTVSSTVLQLPRQNEPELWRKLLEMNCSETFESHFGIFEDQVVVLSSRIVAELSAGEISRAITVVATIADDNNDKLDAEFAKA